MKLTDKIKNTEETKEKQQKTLSSWREKMS